MGCLRHSLQQRPGLCLPRTARWNPGWESAQQGTVLPIQLQGSPLTLCFIVVTLCKKAAAGQVRLSQFKGHQHRDHLDWHKQPLQHWEPEKRWAGLCTGAAPPVLVQCWQGNVASVASTVFCLLPGLKSWPKATLQNWALCFSPAQAFLYNQICSASLPPYRAKRSQWPQPLLLRPASACRTLSMEGWTCPGEWPPLWSLRQGSSTGGHIHWGKVETFPISISSGQGLHLNQKLISPGQYMPAFQEDRWSTPVGLQNCSDSNKMMKCL